MAPGGKTTFPPGGMGAVSVEGHRSAHGLGEQSRGAAPPWGPPASRTGRRHCWNRVVWLHHSGLCVPTPGGRHSRHSSGPKFRATDTGSTRAEGGGPQVGGRGGTEHGVSRPGVRRPLGRPVAPMARGLRP